MKLRYACVVMVSLCLGVGTVHAQEPDLKDAEIPAAEKSQPAEVVVTAALQGGKVEIAALASSTAERVLWKFEGPAVVQEFAKALKDMDRLYARVGGTRVLERIQVDPSKASDFRVVTCTLKMDKAMWIKSSDDWFLETQKLQKTGAQALALLAEHKLEESLAVYREGQKIAEDMQFQTDPFAKPGTKAAAWGGVIDAIETIQKALADAAKGAGDVSELTALLTLQFQYRYALPELSPSLAPGESKDLDALMKTTRERAQQASVRLQSRLRKGEIKVSEADLARIHQSWTLGMLFDLSYTFYNSGRYLEAYQTARQAILTKTPEEATDRRRPLAQDLFYWIAKEAKFTLGMPEAVLKKMPDELRQIWEKTREQDAHLAKDAWDAITFLKTQYKTLAWEPPVDPILAAIKPQLPPEEMEGSHQH